MREIKRKYNSKSNSTSFKKSHKGLVGEKNPIWKGDAVGYGALHDWVVLHKGSPKLCEQCETIEAKKYEWANISKVYKREISDWVRLCTSCHRKYDGHTYKRWETIRKQHA